MAGLALLSVPAFATPILTPITGILSIQGSDYYSNTLNTITFIPGSSSVGGMSTGTLAPFTAGNPVTMSNFSFDGGFVPGSVAFSSMENGITTTLVLETLTSYLSVNSGLVINASGLLSETGFATTTAAFVLTTQDGGRDQNAVTFSATVLPAGATAPELPSIVLLGTGLLGFAGILRYRLVMRRAVAC